MDFIRGNIKLKSLQVATCIVALLLLASSAIYGQTLTLSPVAWQVFLDLSGNPIAGGCLFTFAAGGTTPQLTYTDSGGSSANTDPIELDSAGRVPSGFFLSPTSYRFDLYNPGTAPGCGTPGSLIRSQDNIRSISPFANLDIAGTAGQAISAGDVVYLSNGSGALTAGRWYKADATNTYSSSTAVSIGMAPSAISSGVSGTIRLAGSVTMPAATLTAGTDYYASSTPGALTATAPTNARLIGRADTTQTIILSTPLGVDAPWTVVTTTSTGTQNDFAPGISNNTIIRCNNATLLTINGFASGVSGQRILLVAIGAGEVDLAHQAGASVAGNRLILFATSGVTPLAPVSATGAGGTAELEYDGTTARWRLIAHEQGDWITPTFAAGSFTASAGTWTVAAALTNRFYLKGRTLRMQLSVTGTSVSGTPATLRYTLPNAYTGVSTNVPQMVQYNDNAAGYLNSGTSEAFHSTLVYFYPATYGGTWSISVTSTVINASMDIGIN